MDDLTRRTLLVRPREGDVDLAFEGSFAEQKNRGASDLSAWAIVVALQKYLRTYADWRSLQEGEFPSHDQK